MSYKHLLKTFINDDRGQSTTEYILILAVVVMIAMKFKTLILGKVTGLVDQVGGQMDDFVSKGAN
jgi:Flp pilus assembly pilin Flp